MQPEVKTPRNHQIGPRMKFHQRDKTSWMKSCKETKSGNVAIQRYTVKE